MKRFSCTSTIFFDLFSQTTCCLQLIVVKGKVSVRAFVGKMARVKIMLGFDIKTDVN